MLLLRSRPPLALALAGFSAALLTGLTWSQEPAGTGVVHTPLPPPIGPPATADQALTGVPIPGERLAPSLEPGVVESMEAVLEREAQLPPPEFAYPKQRNGQQGTWEIPSRRWTSVPHSGEHYAAAKWGDTSMGIGFGGEVNLSGVWIGGHMDRNAWTPGVRAVGFRGGVEVGSTGWFGEVGGPPAWFAIDLTGIDRVVFESKAVYQGAGFYGIDDLTFERGGATVVLDFEDIPWRTKLTGSGYAGLTWETGAGDFSQAGRVMHRPQVPPGHTETYGPDPKGLLGAAGAVATAPNLLNQYAGPKQSDPGGGWVPPDTCGAAGTTQFVAAVNQHLSVYDKASGTRLLSTSLQSFFGGSGSKGDPRVAFDHYENRWIVTCSDFNTKLRLAYSLTEDATGSWFKTNVKVSQGSNTGDWPDYPTLGVDQYGIYSGAYMVGSVGMSLFAIDKAPLLQATPSLGTVSAWRQLPYEDAIQPCVTYDNPPGCYAISRTNSSTQRLRIISPPLSNPTMTQLGFVSTKNGNSPPSAPAQGSNFNLSTVDARPMNAVFRNGSVWMAHCVNKAGRAAINWYEIDPGSVAVVQEGTIKDDVNSYFFPSIAVNAPGDVVVGFSASSPNMYAGCWYAGRVATDPPGEMSTPTEYKPGGGPYNQSGSGTNRWGDYSLTSADPTDDTLWTIQEHAKSNGDWGTRVAQFSFAASCGGVSSYCTAGTSASGCNASMSASGTPSATASSGFDLTASAVEGAKDGLFFFGTNGRQANPWGSSSSFQCVTPPVSRAGLLAASGTSGACDGTFSQDLNALWCPTCSKPQKNPGTGAVVQAQLWYRDPQSTSSQTTSLSDAVEFSLCP